MSSSVGKARTILHTVTLFGRAVQTSIEIENSYESSIEFTTCGETYSFVITQWQGRGMGKFIELFHDNAVRDINLFGGVICKDTLENAFVADMDDVIIASDPDGRYIVGPNYHPMSRFQKLNMIEQACKDILSCLSMIADVHQRSILEYCVWYRENHNLSTYGKFVTMMTSNCVVHNVFIAPNQTWTLVEFDS